LKTSIGEQSFNALLDSHNSRLQAASRLNEMLKQISDEVKEETIQSIARQLGVEVPDEPPAEFAPITWRQAREMDRAGIEMGSHTVTHPILPNVCLQRVRRELNESRLRLESVLGHSVTLFCYPNGDMTGEVREEVKRAGYVSAVATEYGFNDDHSDPFALRRIPAASDLARFAQSTSGFEQIKMKLRRAGVIAASVSSSVLQTQQ
jgi:peptidoglycan/xylan/chitin deacetylase (PgdA/CDA1 family)